MNSLKKLNLFILLFASTTFTIVAQENKEKDNNQETKLRFLFGVAAEFGGDEVAKIFFQNGEDQSVNAGQGISAYVGGELQFKNLEKFRLRASLGYKYVTTQANNAHIRMTRLPIEFSANYMITKDIRLGLGLSMHNNIDFKADGIGQDLSFKNSTGPKLEIAYKGIGLSYTIMEYIDSFNNKYSANSFGIIFSLTTPK